MRVTSEHMHALVAIHASSCLPHDIIGTHLRAPARGAQEGGHAAPAVLRVLCLLVLITW